ncbi:DUF5018 domain-containing protein [Pedobacter caeni]|uniref:IPT/TIG domain-containing protein n=1 Tax=Pedobacter caeni TaxID=288992 RepID=A0A1M5HBW8_9SPHI|nr:hypothetical protein [Pedobacter caeni]SHG13292.1 hypothetical protein SAMN04488522_104589 [Pedobacter caeni]
MKIQNYTLLLLLFLFSCKKDSPVVPTPEVIPGKSSEKKITAFKFSTITPEAIGIIDETAKKIAINVPYGTTITAMKPVISVSDKATVNNAEAADFSKIVVYKVTAEDGTTQEYEVTTTSSNPKFSIETYTGPVELEAGNGYFLLKGKGFGTDASKIEVILTNRTTLVKTTMPSLLLLNDTSIGLTIPETLAFGTYSVQLVINGEAVPVPVTLTIVQAAPILESLSSASLAQSETLTINGRFFATGNTLSIIFKSKTTGTIYTINNPGTDIVATSTKLAVKLTNIPGGTYTVQVKSNEKVSATKDVEVIAPVASTLKILRIRQSTHTNGYGFYPGEGMRIIANFIFYTEKPSIIFSPLTGITQYLIKGSISSGSMDETTIDLEIRASIPKGKYKIYIESNGRTSDLYDQIIEIL